MKIIRPAVITATELVASSVPDTPPTYVQGATYAKGDRVQDAEHREYESAQANNTGHALTDPAWWIRLVATNRWRMFDQTNGSQTEAPEVVEVDLLVRSRVNAIALLNIDAAAVEITATVGDRQLYHATFSLVSTAGVNNWHRYFFEPVDRRNDLIVTDLPTYSNMKVRVRVTRPGGVVRIGNLVIGQMKDLGITEIGLNVSIIDYSKKGADDFGNPILIPRPFARKLSTRLLLQNDQVDQVEAALSKLRATPLVWIASTRFAAATVFGFYRDFNISFAHPEQSYCSVEIEGII